MELIDKSAIVAELERRMKALHSTLNERESAVKCELKDLLSFIDTLKVKENKLPNPHFPHLNNIVDKVFGTGNLESFEYEEAEQLVLLAKEELLKDLEVKEVDFEKIWKEYCGHSGDVPAISTKPIAKHFFELGLVSQLTWQDIRLISEIGEEFMNSEESDNCTNDETYYSAILNKLKQLGRDYKTQRQEIRDKVKKGE